MDTIRIEKLQAMNKYKKNQYYNNIFYGFTVLIFSLFCSSPYWFPSLYSFLHVFIFISLPNIGSFIFNPKCLFIVCNVIVFFLVGESKLMGSSSTPVADIYDEYVRNSQSLRRPSTTIEEKKEVKKLELSFIKESGIKVEEDVEEKEKIGEEEEEKERKEDMDVDVDEEEELALPTEELNRKVEDFIAKINQQRRLEAKLLVSCCA